MTHSTVSIALAAGKPVMIGQWYRALIAAFGAACMMLTKLPFRRSGMAITKFIFLTF